VRVRRAVALIRRGGRLLMVKRSGALLDGLWEPPGVELEADEDARAVLGAELERLGVRARLSKTREIVRHTITHRSIEVELWRGANLAAVAASAKPSDAGARWVGPGQDDAPLTALARRLSRMR
jgi:hypothetical protein